MPDAGSLAMGRTAFGPWLSLPSSEECDMTTQDRPTTPSQLNGRHQQTYETIFRHPTAHNLEWHDVRSLLAALGEASERSDGALEVTRSGERLILHAPKHKDIAAVEDVMAIRRFLEKTGTHVVAPPPHGLQLLVVVDHHEAKIYRTGENGAAAKQIEPYDPHGFGRHLRSDTEETDGKRKPERKSFYEAIAKTLRGAESVLIFGSGTGESSAMEQLLADLKKNHKDVAEHVVGSVVVDAHHQTEGQLLAQAREHFASKIG
jgi:hypothetical protein